jgi:micrococcal nuclease
MWPIGTLGAGLLVLAASASGDLEGATGPPAFNGPVTAEVVRVIDGDTFEAAARIWLGEAIDIHVRIEGIDAPELHGRCSSERAQAQAARDFLARRIEGGQVRLSALRYDKYGGRVDAVVQDARGDIGAAMLRARLARPYHGERRQPWCDTS